MNSSQPISFQNFIHCCIKNCLPELWHLSTIHLVDFNLIQLIPQPIRGQNKVLMLILQSEMGHQRSSLDIRPSKHCQSSKVVLLKFQVKIPKRSRWLEPSLHIASTFTPYYIILSRKRFMQSKLLKLFPRIQPQISHCSLIIRDDYSFTVACICDMKTIFQYYRGQCARSNCAILVQMKVLLEDFEESLFYILVGLDKAYLDQFLCGQSCIFVQGYTTIDSFVQIFRGVLGLSRRLHTTRSPPCPSNTEAVNPSIDFSFVKQNRSSIGLLALYETVSMKGNSF